jgi:hypothetical protein
MLHNVSFHNIQDFIHLKKLIIVTAKNALIVTALLTANVLMVMESVVSVRIICLKNIKVLNYSITQLLVKVGCGTKTSENNTYFEATSLSSGECTMTTCPSNSNICQVSFKCKM